MTQDKHMLVRAVLSAALVYKYKQWKLRSPEISPLRKHVFLFNVIVSPKRINLLTIKDQNINPNNPACYLARHALGH